MSQVFCLFHPATGVPGSVFVEAESREVLTRRAAFITATAQAETGRVGLWPQDVAALLTKFYGHGQVPRPRGVMSAPVVDIYVEHHFPDREGGVGPREALLADTDLLRAGLIEEITRISR